MSKQMMFAHALAAAHGHEWGRLDAARVEAIVRAAADAYAADAAIKRAVAEDPNRSEIWGISSPSVDVDGDVFHVTGTGRLSWLIREDGSVTLWVSRRAARVLAALTDPCREGDGDIADLPGVRAAIGEGRYEEGFDVLSVHLPCGEGAAEIATPCGTAAVDPGHLAAVRCAVEALERAGHLSAPIVLRALGAVEARLYYARRFEVARDEGARDEAITRAHDQSLPRELRVRAAIEASGLHSDNLLPTNWYRRNTAGRVFYGSVVGSAPGVYPDGALWQGDVVVVEEHEVRALLRAGWEHSKDPLAAWQTAIDRAVQHARVCDAVMHAAQEAGRWDAVSVLADLPDVYGAVLTATSGEPNPDYLSAARAALAEVPS